ncbi:trafficking protein particle complex subunit 8 isoform X2 [Hordeum vulgare subsp. vulgare]|uniref:trafficking protein particle complex subunit 8 isoform X2 n=1 Tax=Hordeum vulgare subsp. vulgare TaxID=112509 RepID=UPI001D1A3AB3|nr:trafficking protein particle complex subunit 8 isoform X2 [Hordeum vulgare subsp. vulgare]
MDPLRSYLGRILLEDVTPVVMVLTTPLAEAACRKSGLSFVDMLSPFSLFKKIDVPVRTASDQPYRLQQFKIRMVYASDVRKQDCEVADARIKQVVSEANENALPDLLSDPPQLEDVLKKPEAELCPLWIKRFNRELVRTLSFSDHETFDHPVACLLVVSSKDKEPISKFADLFNANQLPPLLNEGIMDPQILKHYLLLHEQQDGPQEIAVNILAEMRTTLGLNDCKLLSINSSTQADGSDADNSWSTYKAHGLHNHEGTCFLNMDDMNEIKDFMQDFASNHIIPYMEQKIRVLNQQVATTRKGFRNQIKNLWWRKRDDVPEAANGPVYTFTSIESQIRVLSDYAFMLRDYELALSNYRLLSTDYKLDKAWKRFAGVQEMSGLCYFMLDQSRKDAEYCMENAFTTYLRIGSSGQRNATRCGLWWAEMLKTRGQHREASTVYFRISNEEPSLHSAVLLEQAACCYLLSSPRMLRKYGFHLILAGNSYYLSDQKQHAVRAYRNALFVYKQNPWSYINNHVHFNVGRWYGVLGIFDVAIKHLLEVIACSHQSLTTQSMFLNDFFHFVQSTGEKFDVYKLQLPVFNMSSLRVVNEDHRTYASNADVDVNESIWQELEEELIPSSSVVRTNWLDTQPKSSPFRNNKACVCVAGEAVKLNVELKNPLQISVNVSGISLICQLSTNLNASETGALTTAAEEDIATTKPSISTFESDGNNFTLSKLDIVLGGGETKRIQLEVTPKVVGILKLVGIRWTLSDSVVGYQYFEVATQKKNKKGKRGARRSLNNNLIVIKGLPKLTGYIECLPTKAFTGDLQLLTLNLRNQSEHAVKNIKMKISHPRFVIPGDSSDLDLEFPQCLRKHVQSDSNTVSEGTKENVKGSLFAFPQDIKIQGGATFSWPIWFHAATPGNFSLYLSLYYEMESTTDIPYRTLRMHYNVEILPSLDVSFAISMCSSGLQEYIVRMDVINKTPSDSFALHQLSCVGTKWAVSTLPSRDSISFVETVPSNQAVSCFFKIKDLSTSSCIEAADGSCGSDIVLSPGDSTDVFDVSRTPITDFHYQERHQQGKLAKVPRSLLDFILISKAVAVSSSKSEQLLSHHTCHCSALIQNPVWWLMEGPRTITHDFSKSCCEANIELVIHNSSEHNTTVRVVTSDCMAEKSQTAPSHEFASGQGGWYDVSLENDIKAIASTKGAHSEKQSSESISPFVWCSLSSAQVDLKPDSSAKIPLKVCIFAPGTYDFSTYELHWQVHSSESGQVDENVTSGGGQGYPFYVNVLQGA